MLRRRRVVAPWVVILALSGLAPASAQPAQQPTAREFLTPVLTFPTGLAAAPDGAVWAASTYADKLVRFDPVTRESREVQLPLRTHPVGLLVDPRGSVWYAASGLGVVGRLDARIGRPKEFALPSILRSGPAIPSPWALTVELESSQLWFTVVSDGVLGRLALEAEPQRREFAVSEVKLGQSTLRPEGIAADGRGSIWVAETGADSIAWLKSESEAISRIRLPPGSQPRGVASGPDGGVWVTLFGAHRLLRVDPTTLKTRAWPMPSGARSSPWAVVVDRAGFVWVSEFVGDTVARFDPKTGRFTTVVLPTPRSGVRALAVDPSGRVWFVGSQSGRLGVIE